MTKQEHEALIVELAGEVDQGRRTEILQTLREDYGETLATVETQSEKLTSMEGEMGTLRTVNNKLFLKLGGDLGDITGAKAKEKEQESKPEPTTKEQEEQDFADIANEF